MQQLVDELWHTRAPVRVIGRHDYLYLFRFASDRDLNHAYLRGPWSMIGGLLVLELWATGDVAGGCKYSQICNTGSIS